MIGGGGRSIAMSALKLSPKAFSDTTQNRSVDLNDLTGTLKALISRSIGREITGEKSLAIRSTLT
jgi:hypothetical protein